LRIDRVLGQGAFAVTYLVSDTVLSATFALKEFLPESLVERAEDGALQPRDETSAALFADGLQNFLTEGRMLAALDHPNIVRVMRCFEANNTAYLLMSYYRGEALDRMLSRGGTLSEEEALALSRPLLDALDHIHRKGFVHQDLKPANIYITEDGDPVLLDFGAAGPLLQIADSSRRTLGSEGYAAIEQSDPNGIVGPWTDIYGLSATLYRCVTGRLPVPSSQRLQTLDENLPDPLEPVSRLLPSRGFSRIVPAIESGLRLLPGQRPQSIRDWRHAFAEAPPTGDREGREWLPMILLGVFALLMAAAVAYLFTSDRSDGEPASTTSQAVSTAPDAGIRSPASPAETARWRSALEADTAFAYRLFLQDFPESIHRDQAQLNLERLDHQAWSRAETDGSRAAIEAYREQFPAGLHDADALIRLEELRLAEDAAARARSERETADSEAWDAARAARTIAAVDSYLAEWPDGLHVEEARRLQRTLQDEANERRAFEAARKLNTRSAYRSYVDAFPGGANVAAALEAIDDLTLRPGKTFRDCADCPTMVVVPAGSFWQGSEEDAPQVLKKETPRRMVTIADLFAVGVFEVTLAQWDACVSAGGCSTHPTDNGWGRESRPAIMVSWNDAVEYTRWLSEKAGQAYSLPSESQWEYMARAGEQTDWLGGDPAGICQYANIAGAESGLRWHHPDCADPAVLETLPVGSLRPNAFGVYDVIGNVAEWTLDCLNLSYLDAPADGSAWGRGICSSRMTRGGSWFTGTKDVRLPARFNLKNGDRNDFTGFRVVRRVTEQ